LFQRGERQRKHARQLRELWITEQRIAKRKSTQVLGKEEAQEEPEVYQVRMPQEFG